MATKKPTETNVTPPATTPSAPVPPSSSGPAPTVAATDESKEITPAIVDAALAAERKARALSDFTDDSRVDGFVDDLTERVKAAGANDPQAGVIARAARAFLKTVREVLVTGNTEPSAFTAPAIPAAEQASAAAPRIMFDAPTKDELADPVKAGLLVVDGPGGLRLGCRPSNAAAVAQGSAPMIAMRLLRAVDSNMSGDVCGHPPLVAHKLLTSNPPAAELFDRSALKVLSGAR